MHGLQVGPKALSHPDPKAAFRAVMRSWLPLSEAVLAMVTATLPDPRTAVPDRMERLLPVRVAQAKDAGLDEQTLQVGLRQLMAG